MAAYRFRIIFSGLCAFVPDKPIKPYQPPYELSVMLVNANCKESRGFLREIGIDPDIMEDHFPLVKFDAKNVKKISSPAFPAEQASVWRLRNEKLSLMCEKSGSGVTIVTETVAPDQEVPDPAKPAQRRDVHWITDIDKVLPGAGNIPRALLNPGTAGNIGAKVVAIFNLNVGQLSSFSLARTDEGKDIVSQFVPPPVTGGSPVRQVLAFEEALEIGDLIDAVTIETRSFVDNSLLRSVTLEPDGTEDLVEIRVMNVCCPDAVELMTGKRMPREVMPGSDEDFKWMYILAGKAGGVEDRWTPIPASVIFPTERSGGQGGGEPAICTGCITKPPV